MLLPLAREMLKKSMNSSMRTSTLLSTAIVVICTFSSFTALAAEYNCTSGTSDYFYNNGQSSVLKETLIKTGDTVMILSLPPMVAKIPENADDGRVIPAGIKQKLSTLEFLQGMSNITTSMRQYLSSTDNISPGTSFKMKNGVFSFSYDTLATTMKGSYNASTNVLVNTNVISYSYYLSKLGWNLRIPKYSFDVTIDDGDKYVATNPYVISVILTRTVSNLLHGYAALPVGDTTTTLPPLVITCTPLPLQLTAVINATLNFGSIAFGSASSTSLPFNLRITSGTSIPTGTFTFSSLAPNGDNRLVLGGAVVNVKSRDGKSEYLMNTEYPITSRNMPFTAILDPSSSIVGEASTIMTVNLLVQ